MIQKNIKEMNIDEIKEELDRFLKSKTAEQILDELKECGLEVKTMENIKELTSKIKYLKAYEIPYITEKYILEIIEKTDENEIELWLQREGYGIKNFLIGIQKEDYTEDFITDYIKCSIEEDIRAYREEHEE